MSIFSALDYYTCEGSSCSPNKESTDKVKILPTKKKTDR